MNPIVIIPTYNEKENISELINEISNNLVGYNFSILVVDDGSPDGTAETVENLNKANVFILKRDGKKGLASAYIDGIKYSIEKGFDAFIEFDADFSHNPKYLPQMIEYLKDNDVVIGSRNVKGGCSKGWTLLRKLISKGGSLYSRLVLSCPIKDLTGGFNGWRLDVINKINLDSIISSGYCFQIEMKYRAFLNNAKIFEFPIVFEDRKFGQSKMSKSIFIEALFNVLKLRLKLR